MEKQVLTTSQMLELIELGIDTSNASIFWHKLIKDANGADISDKTSYFLSFNSIPNEIFSASKLEIKSIPTFTLQDILEMLPERIKYCGETYILCTLRHTNVSYRKATDIGTNFRTSVESDSLLKSAFEMLKWCKQNKNI